MAHVQQGQTTATAAPKFQPYIKPTDSPAEFTIKAVVLGILFGLIFGASTVYLGLRAGLTVSASIPIAVLALSAVNRPSSRTPSSRRSVPLANHWPLASSSRFRR